MSTAPKDIDDIISALEARSYGDYGTVDLARVIRAAQAAVNRVTSADTALLTSDGASQTITVYQIDWAAGNVLLPGPLHDEIAAGDDQDLLADTNSLTLAGGTPVALTADGQTYEVVGVAININGAAALYFVFGAEAADGSEVAPTGADAFDAIFAADPTNWDGKPGVVVARMKIQRTAVDTMVVTHTAAASDEALKAERLSGTVF